MDLIILEQQKHITKHINEYLYSLMLDNTEWGVVQQVEGHAGAYIFVVLVAALKVLNMCCQMGIDNAEASVVENKPHCYTSFVSLKKKNIK